MIPVLQRTYSKGKAIANRVIWTAQEPMPVVFTQDGLLSSGLCGLYQVTGRPVYCSAYQAAFTVPSQDPGMLVQISLVDKNGNVVPGSLLKIYGTAVSALQQVAPPFLALPGTTLQFNVQVLNGVDQYLPQDLILTYYLNFANGLPGFQSWP
jgi:hypothetical protein